MKQFQFSETRSDPSRQGLERGGVERTSPAWSIGK
jgi:hypothetical protein